MPNVNIIDNIINWLRPQKAPQNPPVQANTQQTQITEPMQISVRVNEVRAKELRIKLTNALDYNKPVTPKEYATIVQNLFKDS